MMPVAQAKGFERLISLDTIFVKMCSETNIMEYTVYSSNGADEVILFKIGVPNKFSRNLGCLLREWINKKDWDKSHSMDLNIFRTRRNDATYETKMRVYLDAKKLNVGEGLVDHIKPIIRIYDGLNKINLKLNLNKFTDVDDFKLPTRDKARIGINKVTSKSPEELLPHLDDIVINFHLDDIVINFPASLDLQLKMSIFMAYVITTLPLW